MVDPVTAIAGATAAFNALKKGIQVAVSYTHLRAHET